MLIDESNAAEVATGAVDDGIRGNVFNGFVSLDAFVGSTDMRSFSPFYLAEMIKVAVASVGDESLPSKGAIMAVQTREETIEGSCGGQGTGTFSVDDATGEFWGDLAFSDYCDSDVTLNGKTSFSGTIDTATGQFVRMSFDFNKLKGRDLSSAFVIDGTMYLVHQDFETAMTMNLFIEDSQDSDVFWLNDYHLLVVEEFSTMAINISGKYYNPDHGYVTLSTQQDLILDVYSLVPVSGVLLAIGKNGSAGGPTTARLTCHSDGMFQAEADTDGDGDYDWDSGMMLWDDM
jgi:hypothetical protein